MLLLVALKCIFLYLFIFCIFSTNLNPLRIQVKQCLGRAMFGQSGITIATIVLQYLIISVF